MIQLAMPMIDVPVHVLDKLVARVKITESAIVIQLAMLMIDVPVQVLDKAT